ncbi:MAG: type II toxin-antitoxin system HigB family toxin [Kiritimatiellaeota bacterium]|nr:type II toxin-antitoxin system HigB family toxin [Kiritimatiellota bacterium]
MRVMTQGRLLRFGQQHPDALPALRVWLKTAKLARWTNPAEIKATFGSADPVGDRRMVFDIGGNKYRLIAEIDYRNGVMFVCFLGTHAQYDRVDARTVMETEG